MNAVAVVSARGDIATARTRPAAALVPDRVTVRPAAARDAVAIHRLIVEHGSSGRLLPRQLDEITLHIHRFVVASVRRTVIGCADLTPLSGATAEVRSLVVESSAQAQGIGRRMLDDVTARAARQGFQMICAFTHSPAFFVRAGFSLIPPSWVPEKIARDCGTCPLFRTCGQHSVALSLPGIGSPLQGSCLLHG